MDNTTISLSFYHQWMLLHYNMKPYGVFFHFDTPNCEMTCKKFFLKTYNNYRNIYVVHRLKISQKIYTFNKDYFSPLNNLQTCKVPAIIQRLIFFSLKLLHCLFLLSDYEKKFSKRTYENEDKKTKTFQMRSAEDHFFRGLVNGKEYCKVKSLPKTPNSCVIKYNILHNPPNPEKQK